MQSKSHVIKKIDGTLFKVLIKNGAENLKRHCEEIDALNVFPVPDGDTGTNMLMTIKGGVNNSNDIDSNNIYDVAKKVSRGMYFDARGNSGVILSQIFNGICEGFEGMISVTSIGLAKAFKKGAEKAYKAVETPTEGTILTVIREASEKMALIASSRMSINEFFDECLAQAKETLSKTPDLLPVLKEAGVVDSGGAGLVCILEGMCKAVYGEILEANTAIDFGAKADFAHMGTSEVEFGYCTEFIVKLDSAKVGSIAEFNEKVLIDELSPIGNSMVVAKDEEFLKVHIHTLTPGVVLNTAQKYGEFLKLKIENMTVQHHELALQNEIQHTADGTCPCGEEHKPAPVKPKERKKYAVVFVANGDGLVKTMTELGVDYIVSGGQSMNPSTEDFIYGFDHLNAENILVFPNNKNIVLAAKQAAKIYTESNVIVMPSKTISEGFSAITMLDLTAEPDDIMADVKEVIANVTSMSITTSIRNTTIGKLNIEKNDYIGIVNGKLVSSHRHRINTFKEIMNLALKEDKELVTVIYGSDVTEKEASEYAKYVEKSFPAVEVELINGGQAVYSFIISVE